jgi:hypothetical protein
VFRLGVEQPFRKTLPRNYSIQAVFQVNCE